MSSSSTGLESPAVGLGAVPGGWETRFGRHASLHGTQGPQSLGS